MGTPNELGTNAERWNHTSFVPLSLYKLRTEIVVLLRRCDHAEPVTTAVEEVGGVKRVAGHSHLLFLFQLSLFDIQSHQAFVVQIPEELLVCLIVLLSQFITPKPENVTSKSSVAISIVLIPIGFSPVVVEQSTRFGSSRQKVLLSGKSIYILYWIFCFCIFYFIV